MKLDIEKAQLDFDFMEEPAQNKRVDAKNKPKKHKEKCPAEIARLILGYNDEEEK